MSDTGHAGSTLRRIGVRLFAVTVGLAAASAMAEPPRSLRPDELLFSTLECYQDQGDKRVAFTADSADLAFPLIVKSLGASGWLSVDIQGRSCWLAPESFAPRPADLAAAAPAGASRGVGDAANYATIRVHFATNRKPSGRPEPARHFSGRRGELTFGTSEVSIPRDHRLGRLEQPSLWRLEFKQNPGRHVVLLDVSPQNQADFLAGIRQRVRSSQSRSQFVFVHGYNVGFAEAARRTAQMTYDLGYDGAPVFFSWPSQARLSGYVEDENNNEWSIPDLKKVLGALAEASQDSEIYLIAHSMGNRVATRALAQLLTEKPELRQRFKEIVLIAPDIDADVFARDIAPVLVKGETRVTLYASRNDKALKASQKLHGFPRLGGANPIAILPGIDTVDASDVETDMLGHSYYADAKTVLSDIFEVINLRRPINVRRWVSQVLSTAGRYWKFAKP